MITQEQTDIIKQILQKMSENYLEIQEAEKELKAALTRINNKPTNGDKWRAMTDKQIAKKIFWETTCGECPANGICESFNHMRETNKPKEASEKWIKNCKETILKWLKSEAEGKDYD